MNNQERLMVLKMVEDGKINADDAVKLLDALNAGGIDSFIGENSEKLKDIFADVRSRTEDFAKKIEPTVNDAKEMIGETYKKIEPTLKDVGGKVKKAACDIADHINKKFSNCDCSNNGCSCGESKKEDDIE